MVTAAVGWWLATVNMDCVESATALGRGEGGIRWTAACGSLALLQRELKWKSSVNTRGCCTSRRVSFWAVDTRRVDAPAVEGHFRRQTGIAAGWPTTRTVLDALRIEDVGSACLALVSIVAGVAGFYHDAT